MTMMHGVVEEVSQKVVATKFGEKPTYSFRVGGTWIKSGFKNPNVEVGHEVDFDAVEGKFGIETKSVTILGRGILGASMPERPGSVPVPPIGSFSKPYIPHSRDKVFPIPALHGDRSIIRQNALARASDLYVASHGGKSFAIDLITSSGFIIALARKFEAYTAGDLDMEEAEGELATEAKTS